MSEKSPFEIYEGEFSPSERQLALRVKEQTIAEILKMIVHAWEILDNNLAFMTTKENKERFTRDIQQRKDELGLITSSIFQISYNDAVKKIEEEIKNYSQGTKLNGTGVLNEKQDAFHPRLVDTERDKTPDTQSQGCRWECMLCEEIGSFETSAQAFRARDKHKCKKVKA